MKYEKIDPTKAKPLPDFLQQERILDDRQGAQLFGVSIATWRRLDHAGKLPPAIQVSTRRRGRRVRDLLDHLAMRGRLTLPPDLLNEGLSASRDGDFQPNRKIRQAIGPYARDLSRDSEAVLRGAQPLNSKKGGAK